MIAVSLFTLIGSMTLLILVYGHFRNAIIKTLSDNFLYVIAIIANQGKLQNIDNNLHFFLMDFVLKRTSGDRNFTFSPSFYVGVMASYDGRPYQCLHWNSDLSNDSP